MNIVRLWEIVSNCIYMIPGIVGEKYARHISVINIVRLWEITSKCIYMILGIVAEQPPTYTPYKYC